MMTFDIGIDLGSTKTAIYVPNKGVVLSEPSVVAVNAETGRMIAAGKRARRMIGRNPDSIEVIRPIEGGVISNYSLAEQMLRYFIQKVCGNVMFKPRAVVTIPSVLTSVDRITTSDVVIAAGARKVCLMEEPLAAAFGAGVGIQSKTGSIIVDVGGGTTDVAIVTYGSMALNNSIKSGGKKIDDEIIKYIRSRYNLNIGERTAENIKKEIGSAVMPFGEVAMVAKGINYITGLPQPVELNSTEIYDVIKEPLWEICEAVQGVLELTPPELVADISTDGIYLSGGTAQIKGFAQYISENIGIKATVVDDPEYCVARGTGVMLQHMEEMKLFGYDFRTHEPPVIEPIEL